MGNGSPQTSRASFVSLVGGIARDAKDLLLQEVALTKLAAQYELRQAKSASITLGIGIGAVALGGILLMLMLVRLLEAWTVVPLWGCYGIVGGGLAVVGGVVLAAGKSKAEALEMPIRLPGERVKERAHA